MSFIQAIVACHVLPVHNHSCESVWEPDMVFNLGISNMNRIPEYDTTQNIHDLE